MYTISDVANYLGLKRTKRGHAPAGTFNVVCPFCGDERGKCNMVIRKGDKENVFHCYHCDAAGSMYDLFAALTGLSSQDGLTATKRAARKMRSVLADGEFSFGFSEVIIPKNQEEKADEQTLNHVYRAFLSVLSLKEHHRMDLKRRGLSDEQIDLYGFKSTPDSTDVEAITRKILKKGLSVRGVPGFYKNRSGDWTINIHKKNGGYLCPVYDLKGQITGFQIRSDDKSGPKYLWFTSTGKHSGVSSGSPATFLGDPFTKEVIVTEGILKATVIHALSGKSVIGIPGIDNMASLSGMLKGLSNLQVVYEAVDMDKYMPIECDGNEETCESCNGSKICPKKKEKRDRIQKACVKLFKVCNDYERIAMRWDYSLNGEKTVWNVRYKGLDDWLLHENNKKSAL